ncbi:hypothetical protein DXG03_001737 [Asterophora parasitica]|uniref:MICOS complex subunit MIC60 n=1 Tax=Asterophora parasitica TaxID=117018 RepID=A0A9P7GAF1_9AGAR|nr:hypothetical protein DXG03_001737 [Asterophora parasitica]
MYRALHISRRVAFTSRQGVVKVVRRRLATEAAIPKKKKNIGRRILWVTTGLTGTFYVGSTFAAFYNQAYYDFFSEKVPLGPSMLEYAEKHNWDTVTAAELLERTKNAAIATQRFVTDKINGTTPAKEPEPVRKVSVESQVKVIKSSAPKVVDHSKFETESMVAEAKKEFETRTEKVKEGTSEVAAVREKVATEVKDEVVDLVKKAEDALRTETPAIAETTPAEAPSKSNGKPVYEGALPVGFEPPPGYIRPSPPKKEEPQTPEPAPPAPVALPLVAPAVSSFAVSEPIIAQLAGTIDNLASFLDANPTAVPKVSDVLETAKTDLTALADRIEKAKEDERVVLESKLDEQTREYTQSLLELEMLAQDKLDSQEDDFRKFHDQERAKLIRDYRAKLEHELQTQTELINERLKEEVIAQGIELQRRWIRDIKVRVEQERGGRLGKLEELSSHLKRLERVALDNSTYLDENIRIHALWSAVRALTSSALSAPVRKPFREELRVVRHIASAREDPVVVASLESLESSDVPDVGVEPFADLASWFSSDVAPKVAHVALVPDQNAGVLSHLASHLFSGLRFRRTGLVPGDDVLSVIARAEHYLNEKNLDSAARELNQLNGAAKVLLQDWLDAARRRLEVEQALDVVQAQATLASLLVV